MARRDFLKRNLEKKCSGTLVTLASLPSMTLLNQVKAQADSKSWDWIPWKKLLTEKMAAAMRGRRKPEPAEASFDWMDDEVTKSNMFPKGAKRPAFGKETMLKLAKRLNRATLQSLSRRQDPELEQGTWNETMAEVEHGWIWEDVRRECHDIVIAKRFGLQQSEKLRVIDDCSCGGLNQAVGLSEKFQLHSIDQMASMLAHSLTLSGDNKHPLLQGRTYDLKSYVGL